jgi:hypothetical protein
MNRILIVIFGLFICCNQSSVSYSSPKQNNPIDLTGTNWKITSAQIHSVSLNLSKKTRVAKDTITTDSNQISSLGSLFANCRNILGINTKDILVISSDFCGNSVSLPYTVWDSVITAYYPDPELIFQFNGDSTLSLDYVDLDVLYFSKGDSSWDYSEFQSLAARHAYENGLDDMKVPNIMYNIDSTTDSLRYYTYKYIYTIQ